MVITEILQRSRVVTAGQEIDRACPQSAAHVSKPTGVCYSCIVLATPSIVLYVPGMPRARDATHSMPGSRSILRSRRQLSQVLAGRPALRVCRFTELGRLTQFHRCPSLSSASVITGRRHRQRRLIYAPVRCNDDLPEKKHVPFLP